MPRQASQLIAAACLLLFIAGCSAVDRSDPHWPDLTAPLEAAAEDRWADVDEAVERRLETITALPKDKATFHSVLDAIRESTGVNIVVDWYALELVGIERETKVKLEFGHPTPAIGLLKFSLMNLSTDAFDDDKADFRIRYGSVFISTERNLVADKTWLLYDARWYPVPDDTESDDLYDLGDTIQEAVIQGFADIYDPRPEWAVHAGFMLIHATPDQHRVIRKLLLAMKDAMENE